MKYIDADLLREVIKEHILFYAGQANLLDGTNTLDGYDEVLSIIDSLQQEQPEMDLEKFTEKMDAWKARYNYPDNFSIKATMAFTARMFYMYPNVAREWYDSLPKVTLD